MPPDPGSGSHWREPARTGLLWRNDARNRRSGCRASSYTSCFHRWADFRAPGRAIRGIIWLRLRLDVPVRRHCSNSPAAPRSARWCAALGEFRRQSDGAPGHHSQLSGSPGGRQRDHADLLLGESVMAVWCSTPDGGFWHDQCRHRAVTDGGATQRRALRLRRRPVHRTRPVSPGDDVSYHAANSGQAQRWAGYRRRLPAMTVPETPPHRQHSLRRGWLGVSLQPDYVPDNLRIVPGSAPPVRWSRVPWRSGGSCGPRSAMCCWAGRGFVDQRRSRAASVPGPGTTGTEVEVRLRDPDPPPNPDHCCPVAVRRQQALKPCQPLKQRAADIRLAAPGPRSL